MTHALIVGGTGMLRHATLHLATQHTTVSVVARTQQRLETLAQEISADNGHLNPVALDYRDTTTLQTQLKHAIQQFGPISLTVCWIHSVAPEAPFVVAETVGNEHSICRYIDVVGSAGADPSQAALERIARIQRIPKIAYQRVILGFVQERGYSRWLTDAEISEGVLHAVEHADQEKCTVGAVHPWSARP
ncbi:MAG: SDR family NAD(P)-dependent oxidoreductase [Chloroflexota bacterium]